jgi:hypothetical protein
MRWVRHACLAFLSLFLLATSASAECAWVLWLDSLDMKTHEIEGPIPRSSYKTADECIKEIDSVWRGAGERLSDSSQHSRSAPTEATTLFRTKKSAALMTYRCLPDTVDPRGPKGK